MKPITKILAIFHLVCLIGLIFQVLEVSESYFAFRIRRVIILDFPYRLPAPGISLCFDLSKGVPEEVIRSVGGSNKPDSWNRFQDFLEVVSVDNLLELTTPIEDVLRHKTGCSIRFATNYAMTYMNHTRCTEYFKVEKYIQRQFVCFKVTPTIPVENNALKPLLMTEYLLAPVETGTIYSLYLNATAFQTMETITAFVHGYDTSHFEDSVVISVHPVSIIGSQGSSATVTFEENVVHRLEAPFTSGCTRMSDRVSVLETFVDILNRETVRLLNKSCSFTQLYSGNHSLMTERDFNVEKFKTTFKQITDKYDPYSLGWTCDVKWYQSRVSVQSYQLSEQNQDSKYKLVVHVTWPQSHSIKIHEEPLQTIIDYLIYIGSSLGFWFGFSAISIVDAGKIMKIFLDGKKSKKEKRGEEVRKKLNVTRMTRKPSTQVKRFWSMKRIFKD